MKIVILGLAITSSWGNGHATTYRALMRALSARGHDVLFLERDAPWYAENRDLPRPPYGRTSVYRDLSELEATHSADIAGADLVILGSYVPDGIAIGDMLHRLAMGVTAFYDIDTPVTLARLEAGGTDYIDRMQIPRYDVYLSFTGGPLLERLQRRFGARRPRPLYCSVDCDVYFPEPSIPREYDLGYLGTFSQDRQRTLDSLLTDPASRWPSGRFVLAGPQYPDDIRWPPNVRRIVHLSPADHRAFYNRLRYTLNVTRSDMVQAGYSPSVRLFEAAACGTPIISDVWTGIDQFFVPGKEILLARRGRDTLSYVRDIPEKDRLAIAENARARVLRLHTSTERARELEEYVGEVHAPAERSRPPEETAALPQLQTAPEGSATRRL
jgi:spore maturation protein CgeB